MGNINLLEMFFNLFSNIHNTYVYIDYQITLYFECYIVYKKFMQNTKFNLLKLQAFFKKFIHNSIPKTKKTNFILYIKYMYIVSEKDAIEIIIHR